MIAYIDTSVVLRRATGAPDSLAVWSRIERPIASALVEVECLRTLDRLRLHGDGSEEVRVQARERTYEILQRIETVRVTDAVLLRASRPMPVVLGTLDAIHLATALLWIESTGDDLAVATHDRALARGARAFGLRVHGVE